MRKWKVLITVAVAVGGVVAAPAMSAQASTVFCNGLLSGTTNGAVIVPSGGACLMDAATVKGSVTVFPNAVLDTCNTYIGGNVQSSQDYVGLGGGTVVQGNVVLNRPGLSSLTEIEKCIIVDAVTPKSVAESASDICPDYIGGNVTVSNAGANGETVEVCDSHIVGNVQVLNNQENVFVTGNRIDGSLTCVHNFYAYDIANVVHGWDVGCITETP